ncbi:DotU family type IV/VI secretion system protein, partial [Paraburkholderia sp.]|uniref:DotU family type IV/VI secretion system protein n=1 Tax=Paraburkholderia sp. TaxID=1926495 RepID=UPI00286F169E
MDWSATALVTVFGYDRQGGDRVYAIATEALHTPHENRHLIAVIQQILERGFKGRYRFANDSAQRIAAIQQQIEQAVTADIPRIALPAESVRAAEPPAESAPATVEIHPVDQVTTQTPPPPNTRLESRRWPVAALFGLLLIAAAAAIGYSWHTPIVPPSPATSTPAPSGALAARLTDRLASDLSTGTVSLVENAGHTTVTLRLEGIFEAGQSNIDPRIKSMISRIGQEIAQTPCTVLVTGHTDDQPFAQTEHSSNLTLSDARALEVVQILVSAGVTPARIHSTGKGNAEPAADNSTAQGRKRNRRVEITVTE